MRDGHGVLLVQAQQHLRVAVAEMVDEAVVQPAETGAWVQGHEWDAERAYDLRHAIAAIEGAARFARLRTLDGAGVVPAASTRRTKHRPTPIGWPPI